MKGATGKIRMVSAIAISGIMPVAFFQVFMTLTDHHSDRPTIPFGLNNWNSDAAGLLVPPYGPLKEFMAAIVGSQPGNFEAYAYLGMFLILLSIIVIVLLPFTWKKFVCDRPVLCMFFASVFLLIFSFGWHNTVMDHTGVRIKALDQFRATGRFAWFFYYLLPLLVLPLLWQILRNSGRSVILLSATGVVYFLFNLFEAHHYFRFDIDEHWKFRNIFNKSTLTAEERKNISIINELNPEGLIPLRLFHGGSEMYERPGIYYAMPPSMFYSYHCGLPIISAFMSRTSITETENLVNAVNPYVPRTEVHRRLRGGRYLVVKASEPLMVDEERLLEKSSMLVPGDSVELRIISRQQLFNRNFGADVLVIKGDRFTGSNTFYIRHEEKKPFTEANINDVERIFIIDSNQVDAGEYVVSMHYFYSEKNYRAISGNMIITRATGGQYSWHLNPSLRVMNGFYKGFGVFEYKFLIEEGCRYEFLIKGYHDQKYHISDFMVRPADTDVLTYTPEGDPVFNNFPSVPVR